ncbi:tyrosine-type recombinase/integrase [Rhodococcus hoagii]|nr:tyrosine-type recombinase/integrase [Prescottella equi]
MTCESEDFHSMARQRLRPGEWGKITTTTRDGKHVAKVRIRDLDGVLRLVEATGTSAEDARRNVQTKLTNRTPPTNTKELSRTSLVSQLAEYWLEEKSGDVAPSRSALHRHMEAGVRASHRQLAHRGSHHRPHRYISSGGRQEGAQPGPSRAHRVQRVFSTAVRLDLMPYNPARETSRPKVKKTPVRAMTVEDFAAIRARISDYCRHEDVEPDGSVKRRPGPKPGQDLQDIMDLLIATGGRISEVLALQPEDCDVTGQPATVTICGTLVVPRVKGERLYRQEYRKGEAPPLTVALPDFAADTLRRRLALPRPDGSISALFVTGTGNWVSPANVRRAWRAALGEQFDWVKPHSFRRTVATLVKQQYGVEGAQSQLGHSSTRITEAHYIERVTTVPDMTSVLNTFGPSAAQSVE